MQKNFFSTVYFFLFIAAITSQSCTQNINKEKITREVISQLKECEAAWNEGSIEKYMGTYLQSDSLRFVGNNGYKTGWKNVLEGYKRGYKDRAAMGHLTFSELAVTPISDEAALMYGRYTLQRKDDKPTGVFTLLFLKTKDGWRIAHDHTSSPCE